LRAYTSFAGLAGRSACGHARSDLRLVALLLVLAVGCAARSPAAEAPGSVSRPSQAVRTLRADLATVFGAPLLARGLVAVQVQSLATGEILFQLHPHKLVVPASNMKIVTMAAAAERLGWDHRFETRLVSAAPVENGRLRGDLVAVGSGDPSFNDRDGGAAAAFGSWIAHLRAAGITGIDGRIVGDDRAFDAERIGAGWAWDYLGYGYAAPGGALQYHENLVWLTLAPGVTPGDPVQVELRPDDSGLTVLSRMVTVPAGDPLSVELRRLPGTSTLEIAGSLPVGAEPIARTASVDDPTLFFARALRQALLAAGIEVAGEAVAIGATPESEAPVAAAPAWPARGTTPRVLAIHHSPPLRELGTVMMKVSQNLYADTLLKALAPRSPATTAEGREIVADILDAWGIPDDSYVIYDGSGLSRYNYLTVDMLVRILKRMYEDPAHRESFVATLPVAGVDGTLARRLRRTHAEGNGRAKTGSIANMRALSGYVTTRDGEPLVFSMVVNHVTLPLSIVDYVIDTGVEHLANFTRRP
jgi:serine-type D-Ala-D-Ala carboxypeptidase/endopeptidase (penicillin-binding protein 4)